MMDANVQGAAPLQRPRMLHAFTQAFYEAGMAWREVGQYSMAFVMLNRFLDLCDAMDEPDSTTAVRTGARG